MGLIKKKRVSKKNKSSWRKNIDVKDVDNFLEDQRLEERLGIKVSELKDEDLFHIDKKGQNQNVELPKKEVFNKPIAEITKTSMRLMETYVPKCFEPLVKRSAVPPHIIKKTREKKESTSHEGKKICKQKLKKKLKKSKHVEELKAKQASRKQMQPKKGQFTYDVWLKENDDRNLNGCAEWLSNDTIRHTLHNTGKLKKQVPKTIISKTSKLPAIESPHPGISYNPSLKDHTNILEKVAEAEIEIINEEKHLNRVTTKMFGKVSQQKLEKEQLAEMTVGLSMKKTDSDDDDGADYKAINPPVKNKKKTLQKRRKLKEALLLKEKLRQQKIEKKKLSDIYKLRKFNEVLSKQEEKILKNIERRKKDKEKKPFTTKVLSQVKYIEPEVDFNLAEELSGNLRNIKTEGNLLYDRFKSLQKRNVLQPTLKRHVKKRKVKKYERAHTKMGWEPQGFEPFLGNNNNFKKRK